MVMTMVVSREGVVAVSTVYLDPSCHEPYETMVFPVRGGKVDMASGLKAVFREGRGGWTQGRQDSPIEALRDHAAACQAYDQHNRRYIFSPFYNGALPVPNIKRQSKL